MAPFSIVKILQSGPLLVYQKQSLPLDSPADAEEASTSRLLSIQAKVLRQFPAVNTVSDGTTDDLIKGFLSGYL